MIAKVINLDTRNDKWIECETELGQHFTLQRVSAIQNESGWIGLAMTYRKIFSEAQGDILIFEDDATYRGTIDDLLNAVNSLPEGWEMLMLGANIIKDKLEMVSEKVYRTYGSFTTHAIYYSHKLCKEMASIELEIPIDYYFMRTIHPRGNSYVVYPFLSYQRPSDSDIEKQRVNYSFSFKKSEEKIKKIKEKKI